MTECRNCGEELTKKEKSYGWGDTCLSCITETAGDEELFYIEGNW